MKRVLGTIAAMILVGTCAGYAQEGNPLSTQLKGSWTNIRNLLTKMADKMPDENYRYKPTLKWKTSGSAWPM
jgi:hypothetical protein